MIADEEEGEEELHELRGAREGEREREATEAQNGCVADSQTDVGQEAGEAASIPLTRAIKPLRRRMHAGKTTKTSRAILPLRPKNTPEGENMKQYSWDIKTNGSKLHVLQLM